jgi:hypothetical protein
MVKRSALLLALAVAAPTVAHAGKLVHVTPKLRAEVIRAVNQTRRAEGIKNARGMTVLVNKQGHGLAFSKGAINDVGITNPYSFTIKNGKISDPAHLYMARLGALKGNF